MNDQRLADYGGSGQQSINAFDADDADQEADPDDERPEDCICPPTDGPLPCWPCWHAGFRSPNPEANQETESDD